MNTIFKYFLGLVVKNSDVFIKAQKALVSGVINKVKLMAKDPIKAIATAYLRSRK